MSAARFEPAFRFPDEQEEQRRTARRLAWLSDILTAVPPADLLVAMRFEVRDPTERFPIGYFRSISVAFLVTAVILSLIGCTCSSTRC